MRAQAMRIARAPSSAANPLLRQPLPAQQSGATPSGPSRFGQNLSFVPATPGLRYSYGPLPTGPMSRRDVEAYALHRFAIPLVENGTFEEQRRWTSNALTRDQWSEWNPGATSEIYSDLLQAFDQIEQSFGGV